LAHFCQASTFGLANTRNGYQREGVTSTFDQNNMKLLNQRGHQPYEADHLNSVYNLLFCDTLDAYQSVSPATSYPWAILLASTPHPAQLAAIASDESLEARPRLLACYILSATGSPPTDRFLLGVIIEVAMPEGLDVLAAFNDGTARYINHTEKLLIWDTRTAESDQLIGQLLAHSQTLVSRIGRWEGERRPAPTEGMARLTLLVSDGIYFGEGPFNALYADSLGGPVINAGIQLMDYLTRQVETARV
jgi:hypothetical protein